MARSRRAAIKAASKEKVRGRHFPYHPKLERLLETFDPAIGFFEIEMFRRNARDLRKWLEGPEAFFDVPPGPGLRMVELPRGWGTIFSYTCGYFGEAGKVTAFFIPPPNEAISPERSSCSAAEPATDVEGTPPVETPALAEA